MCASLCLRHTRHQPEETFLNCFVVTGTPILFLMGLGPIACHSMVLNGTPVDRVWEYIWCMYFLIGVCGLMFISSAVVAPEHLTSSAIRSYFQSVQRNKSLEVYEGYKGAWHQAICIVESKPVPPYPRTMDAKYARNEFSWIKTKECFCLLASWFLTAPVAIFVESILAPGDHVLMFFTLGACYFGVVMYTCFVLHWVWTYPECLNVKTMVRYLRWVRRTRNAEVYEGFVTQLKQGLVQFEDI